MKSKLNICRIVTLALAALCVLVSVPSVMAADVLTNGTFDANLNGWSYTAPQFDGTRTWDNVVFGNASGSMKYLAGPVVKKALRITLTDTTTANASISSTDAVNLSFWWRKYASGDAASTCDLSVVLVKPSGATVTIWSNTTTPTDGEIITSTFNQDISADCDETGIYKLRVDVGIVTSRTAGALIQVNVDDFVLDATGAANAPPVVTDIPNQTIAEGSTFATITLDNYVSDPDNTDAEMTWTYSGNTELTVDIVSRVATITIPDINWNGAETITFRATDPGSLWDEDPATFTVTAQNDPPVVTDIPNQTIAEGATFTTITLDDYVSDVDNSDAEMVWTYSGNTELLVDITNRIATITTPSPTWQGNEIITFRATDPGSLWDEDPATFTVTPTNDPPVVTNIPNQTIAEGSTFATITLDNYVSDPDNTDAEMTWTYSGNTELTVDIVSRVATITIPDINWNGAETITFRATDPGLLWSEDPATLTVTAQNDAPIVAASATTVSPATVNRLGAVTTVISASFSDVDQPGVGVFNCTFKIRDGASTELTLVNNQPNGGGGLTISDGGGGSYTASYTYNPDDAQAIDLYDLYFEVSDGSDNAIDPYASNDNELSINQQQAPAIVAGATVVSVSPVNRYSTNTTVISTDFVDADQPGVNAFTATFKIRDNVSTEYTLVNNQPNGGGGLIITDGGGGNYTASYTYNPDDNQLIGLYDLYFTVSDGSDSDVDDYVDNTDELEIEEILPPAPPTVSTGAARVSVSPVDRLGSNTTVLSADFSDINKHPVGTFNCTFKIREPNDVTELVLVNNLSDGAGGLTITDNGNGNYTASYTYNPSDVQTIGFYDLYFEVTDGSTPAVDGYNNNLNELRIQEVIVNEPPVIATGATQVSPSALDRAGAGTTTISATFNDADDPGVSAFSVTFRIAAPQGQGTVILADALQNGVSGMTITAGSGTSYTASFSWDPPANAVVGFYDLYCEVSDGVVTDVDDFVNNVAELQVTNGGENARPIGSSDAVFASPSGVERIGANTTTLAATFVDGDGPAVSVFRATFKLRKPDNSTEVVLATNSAHGQNGVTIVDLGGGVYTASISWDPADAEVLGYWDLYFAVTDGIDTLYNSFIDNANELQLYDAVSNNIPSIVSDTTYALPISVNRIGSEHVMLQSAFSDVDMPGKGAFNITFKVRDPGSTEITVVNSAVHGEQGLRVVHKGGGTYEASVLWDPDVADATGLYDLYFEVTDNIDAAVSDGYTPNSDELTVTSSAVLGDGNLLHRNNTASASCGDATNACHNIMDHQSQDCRVCHTPHGTSNIYLIRETIQTPNSGPKTVDFRTLGIGDPYNDPDPTPGVFAGVMADSTDNVFTGVCEVCHTAPTGHHRNDGSQPGPNHNDAIDCTSCHPHEEGFAVSGGGESSGGSACACHSSTFSPMNTSTTSYHHQLDSDSPDYTISSHTCLSCHVDHDIFRPDLNPGFGTRASNLRRDITTSVVQGSSAVLLNSDYESSGSGGICLSCHVSTQTKRFTPPDASTSTRAIVKADFDASTAHNYIVPNTFNSDGSTFNGVCVKCHTDQTAKSYQASPGFGLHNSVYGRILQTLGAAAPTDPMEEKLCFGCHWTAQNPNSGSNLDYFGVQAMTTASMRIGDAMALTYGHPTTSVSGVHKDGEVAGDFADGNRHAECADCHGVHAAIKGTHDGSTSLASNALKGAWGVRPTWPTAPTPTDNANVFSAPTVFTRVEDATLTEYEICLKCHSNYTTLPSGNRNLAEELNPAYASTHGITSFQTNSFCNSTTMNEPWGTTGRNWCSDCHRSDNAADPEGPHGSNAEHLLVATIVSNSTVGTPLCDVCHKSSVYWDGSATPSDYDDHPATQGQHYKAPGCFSCHMWDHASTAGLGLSTSNWPGGSDATGSSAPPIKIWVHGQNRKWVYNEQDGSAGTQQPVENFINGYIANMDHGANRCWTETCKVHSNKAY